MNKIAFFLPRLLALTLIAGVATLLMAGIFKLLLLATLLGGVATLVKRGLNNRRHSPYSVGAGHGIPWISHNPTQTFAFPTVSPATHAQSSEGIVPID